MAKIAAGTYHITNVAFSAPIGDTVHGPPAFPSFPLPYRVVALTGEVDVPAFTIREWHREGGASDLLYAISIGDRVTYPSLEAVQAQEEQNFGWKVEARPEVGIDVYGISYQDGDVVKYWYLGSGEKNTSIVLKDPQGGDRPDGFLFAINPAFTTNADKP